MRTIALILLFLGILSLAVPYFSYTKRDKVLEMGSVEAFKTEKQTVAIPPIAGIVMVGAGIILLFGSARRKE